MPIRLIQVGIGRWGHDWVNVAQQSPAVELVGIVDLNAEALKQAQRTYAIPAARCFTALDDALNASAADAVLVTTSLGAHVPVALAALTAGKHVLIEKPFAPSLAEGQRVVAAAQQAGRVAMISQNYRFFPAVQAAAALVRAGSLGAVDDVTVAFRFPLHRRLPDGHAYFSSTQPLLTDMAIHHFDLLRAVLGQESQRITCQSWNPPWSPFSDPPTASAIIHFAQGTAVTYHGTWLSPTSKTAWAGEWRMACARGEIAWTSRSRPDAHGDRVTVRATGKAARRLELPALPATDRAGSLLTFANAITSGTEPPSSARDNLGSLALMFAAVESAATERTVALPTPDEHREESFC